MDTANECPYLYDKSGKLQLNPKCLQCKLRLLIDNYYFMFVYLCILLILLYNKGFKYAIIYTIIIICIVFYAFMCSTSASLSIRSVETYVMITIVTYLVFYIIKWFLHNNLPNLE